MSKLKIEVNINHKGAILPLTVISDPQDGEFTYVAKGDGRVYEGTVVLSGFDPWPAQAGMAWSDIAASAYRAYAASTGNKNFRGDPMPAFNDLPQPIKTAWEASVRQVGNCLNSSFPNPEDAEQGWNGWTPPGICEVQQEE